MKPLTAILALVPVPLRSPDCAWVKKAAESYSWKWDPSSNGTKPNAGMTCPLPPHP